MPEAFLSISEANWEIIFMILKYIMAALALAYLTVVFVKQKNNLIDLKGQILEQQIDSYKEIHRFVMRLQSLIASPSQKEEYYQGFLSLSELKTGYQGFEYCSIFQTPIHLLQFGIDINKLVDKTTIHLDYDLEQKLSEFQCWMDDVVEVTRAFAMTESDSRWHKSKKKIEQNSILACQLLGIALQDDINAFYEQFDRMLKNRLQRIRLSSISPNSFWIRIKRMFSDYCEEMIDKREKSKTELLRWFYNHCLYRTYGCSQLLKQKDGILTLLTVVHFSEEIEKQSFRKQSMDEFSKHMMEFQQCFITNMAKGYQHAYD